MTRPKPVLAALLRAAGLVACLILPAAAQQASSPPAAAAASAWTGSAACATCHAAEAEAWSHSDHALAWTQPTPEHVLGDFSGVLYEGPTLSARFTRAPDGAFLIEAIEPDGSRSRHEVKGVAGIRPLQQYLVETEPGRLQSFDVAWDTEKKAWFDLYPDQSLPPGDGLHWSGPYKTWNARCAECHATNYDKGYDPATRRYTSTQVEIGVGCEACHGPGRAHQDWAEKGGPAPANSGFTVDFARPEALETCAGCHSRREAFLTGMPTPGTPYADAWSLALLRPGLYHADGQILEEVYVWGSFQQSKMRAKGVGCMDCHDPHTGERKLEGAALCAQCHSPAGNPRFPSLRKQTYDDPAHTFHAAGTPGAQCVSCHMIERTYMQVDGRRDHSFRIPRPDLAGASGAPDACTDCHEDRTPEWAAAEIAARFPDAGAARRWGPTLARGRLDPGASAAELADLALDPAMPGIVRATALQMMEQSPDPAAADRTEPALSDPDPLVRAAAVAAQRGANPQDRVLRILPLLKDPARLVRMAAARGMLDAPIARLPPVHDQAMRAALGEWRASMGSRTDFPETHLQLGGMALTMRNFPAAEAAFREAVAMDPQLIDAWSILARMAAATKGAPAALAVLGDARRANPDDPTLAQMEAQVRAAR